jgi:beta-lactamase superfamily II metal-dependent hydrolase
MTKSNKRTFIAICVGQGGAFFLQRRGLTALVDGGRSAQVFPYQFQRVTKRNGVDILVCTHNDADHAVAISVFKDLDVLRQFFNRNLLSSLTENTWVSDIYPIVHKYNISYSQDKT